MLIYQRVYGRVLKWGYPNSWMVFFMENPKVKDLGVPPF